METLYELGDRPELGRVPEQMFAPVIRPERFGEPSQAFATEVVDMPKGVLVGTLAIGEAGAVRRRIAAWRAFARGRIRPANLDTLGREQGNG